MISEETIDELVRDEKRAKRIVFTYERAVAARAAVPNVPLKDVFFVAVTEKGTGRIAHKQFVSRGDWPTTNQQLNSRFPATQFFQCLNCNLEPYSPRKGELTFKQWLKNR